MHHCNSYGRFGQNALSLVTTLVTLSVLLPACAAPATNLLTATAQSTTYCPLRVEGRWIKDSAGNTVVLQGANLPTITAMEASTYQPDARLRDLATAGARIMRIAVDEQELTPTFVPAKVVPLIQQANTLGMVVVLSWDAVIAPPIDDAVDNAEDWLRLAIVYLRNNPGVWLDLYSGMQDVPPLRQRNIAQRLIDVLKGFRVDNMIIVNDPVWLLEHDTAVNQPLTSANVVYGINVLANGDAADWRAYNTEQTPFLVTQWGPPSSDQNPDVAAFLAWADSRKIGSIATIYDDAQEPNMIAKLSPLTLTPFGERAREYWQTHNQPGCPDR